MCMLVILAYVYTSSLTMHGVVRHDTVGVVGCNHAEADTRICLHAKVVIVMIHHAWKFSATLWMDTGTYNGKNRRCVNLSAIAMRIGPKMCQALRAYHAFTGQITRQQSFEREGSDRSGNWRAAVMPNVPSSQSHRETVDASSERALLKFGATKSVRSESC